MRLGASRIGRARAALAAGLLGLAAGCGGREFAGGGELRARKKLLEREVASLREGVARLERGEPILPEDDVAVAVKDVLVRDLIAAQLPFETEVESYELTLREAEVLFRGAPTVRLRGRLRQKEGLELEALVEVLGALDALEVDEAAGTLRARIAVDHIGLEKAAGAEAWLAGPALDELARALRLAVQDKLPPVRIPVKVQQSLELPAVTEGPVRIDGARLPIQASVSRVFAAQGELWIAIRFVPGDLVKTAEAPEAGDAKAEEAAR
jgi:hypothetical protein